MSAVSWADQVEASDEDVPHPDRRNADRRGRDTRPAARGAAGVAAVRPPQAGAADAPAARPPQEAADAPARPLPAMAANAAAPPLLAPLMAAQGEAAALQGEPLAAYKVSARDKPPASTPFSLGYNDPANHAACRTAVEGVVRMLKAYNKCHPDHEARTLVLVDSCFVGPAAKAWQTCVRTAVEQPLADGERAGVGEGSQVYCALRSFLRLYTSPVAHEAMRARLRELKWDPKGVAENQAAWTEFVDEYGLVAALTAHLDLTKRLAPLTWAHWFTEFKARLPPWAVKITIERPDAVATAETFWSALAAAEPPSSRSGLRALTNIEEPAVEWRDAALSALRAGDFILAEACLGAVGHEDELPPVTPSYLHAMTRGAPMLARNGKPLECWTCKGNHLQRDCDDSGPMGSGSGPKRSSRPANAPGLVNRPGLGGQTHVTSVSGVAAGAPDLQASIHALTQAVQAQGLHFQAALAAITPAPAGLHQLSQEAAPPTPTGLAPVMVSPTAPEGYIQVGRSTLADGADVPVWATEAALRQSGNE